MDSESHPKQHGTQHPFPEHLPPRRIPKSTWRGRNCPSIGMFLACHYRSFSLRKLPDKRTRWRRISMWIIQIFRIALSVFGAIGTLYIDALIITAIIAFVAIFFTAWNLAIIGDAVGVRRVMGIKCTRKGFDWFLHTMAVVHFVIFAAMFWWSLWIQYAVWGLLGVVIFGVALMASKAPDYLLDNAGVYDLP